jgi:lipopolysaccharide biosynthesis glycosyltransferase
MITLVTSADDNYAHYLGVMLFSLFRNKIPDTAIDVYVIDGGISQKNKGRLSDVSRKFAFTIHYLTITDNVYGYFYIDPIIGYITPTAFYRLSIPDLFTKDTKKVLYMDCDVVVRKDLLDLWNSDISSYYLAAVNDWGPDAPTNYFNSGVMLLNLENIRQCNIMSKARDYIKKYNPLMPDQDSLNFVANGKYLRLSQTFNVMSFLFTKEFQRLDLTASQKGYMTKDAHIVHFTGNYKFTIFLNHNPYKYIFYEYLLQTPWKWRIFGELFRIPWQKLKYSYIKYGILNKHKNIHSYLKRMKRSFKKRSSLN